MAEQVGADGDNWDASAQPNFESKPNRYVYRVWGPSVFFLIWPWQRDPERNDILRLEGDVQATSDDPERNDILRLDEVKRRKSMLINAY